MADKAALTRLRREYAIIQQSQKTPHIVARPSESNMLVWHFVLHDLPAETPYRGGVYEGKLAFPREYPLKPPAIYMITPSGRFEASRAHGFHCLGISWIVRAGSHACHALHGPIRLK